jgi:hypothetical protein
LQILDLISSIAVAIETTSIRADEKEYKFKIELPIR